MRLKQLLTNSGKPTFYSRRRGFYVRIFSCAWRSGEVGQAVWQRRAKVDRSVASGGMFVSSIHCSAHWWSFTAARYHGCWPPGPWTRTALPRDVTPRRQLTRSASDGRDGASIGGGRRRLSIVTATAEMETPLTRTNGSGCQHTRKSRLVLRQSSRQHNTYEIDKMTQSTYDKLLSMWVYHARGWYFHGELWPPMSTILSTVN